jgi:hypothetical protein
MMRFGLLSTCSQNSWAEFEWEAPRLGFFEAGGPWS